MQLLRHFMKLENREYLGPSKLLRKLKKAIKSVFTDKSAAVQNDFLAFSALPE